MLVVEARGANPDVTGHAPYMDVCAHGKVALNVSAGPSELRVGSNFLLLR
jgi:hypothetical protein